MNLKLSQAMSAGNMSVVNRILDRYKRDPKEMEGIIRDICSALEMPNILLYHIIGREIGYSDSLNDRIKSYEEFYRIDSKDIIDC